MDLGNLFLEEGCYLPDFHLFYMEKLVAGRLFTDSRREKVAPLPTTTDSLQENDVPT